MPAPGVGPRPAGRVTVLMSVYNDAAWLPGAVASILNQTLRDFDFLIVDDGSTDETANLLAKLHDDRIRVLRNERNLGLTRSLAAGLDMCRGEFVARMDADDRAHRTRLARQVAFLDAHPRVGIAGSRCDLIDEHGHYLGLFWAPASPQYVRWTSLLSNPFAHPAVMLRRGLFARHQLNYDVAYPAAQDYELWTRALGHMCGANLPSRLLAYRVRAGITASQRPEQLQAHDAIALRTLRAELPGCVVTAEQVSQLRTILIGKRPYPAKVVAGRGRLAELYLDLLAAFIRQHSEEPGLAELRRGEAARVARLFLLPSPPPSAPDIRRRLTELDPLWPAQLGLDLARGLLRRVRRRL